MDPFWREMVALIVSPVVIAGAVAWFLRSWMQQGFQKELEKFRVELEKDKDDYLARSSLIHQKRADAIWEMHNNIALTHSRLYVLKREFSMWDDTQKHVELV